MGQRPIDSRRTRYLTGPLTAFGAEPTQASITVIELTPPERLKRAVLGVGACWGGAVVGVFFPVVHFVLVPTLVLGGIGAAVVLGRQSQRVLAVRGVCPRCRSEQEFEASGRLKQEQILACPGCHANVTLTVEQGQAAATGKASIEPRRAS